MKEYIELCETLIDRLEQQIIVLQRASKVLDEVLEKRL